MIRTMRRPLAAVLAAAAVAAAAFVATGSASPSDPSNLANVAAANTKTPGVSSPNVLSVGLTEAPVAQGSNRLENGTQQVPFYGYDGNGTLPLPVFPSRTEASKTEPDKNTYLVLDGLTRRRPDLRLRHALPVPGARGRDSGLHHAHQPRRRRGAPRDAAGDHRTASGAACPTSTAPRWDPWAAAPALHRGGIEAAAASGRPRSTCPRRSTDLTGIIGQGGYEGIQNDSDGNLWIVEDAGGPNGTANPHAKQPNSFLYRFVPDDQDRPDQGRQAAGAAGHVAAQRPADRLPRRAGRRRHHVRRHEGPAHLRQFVRDATG